MKKDLKIKRYLELWIKKDLKKKIIFLSGPRQVGKTSLSKLIYKSYDYLNWDNSDDRLLFKNQSWNRKKKLIIFDEIHKMPNFKRWLKGIYDKEGVSPQIIVTGSAKLNIAKKMGDSLAGRFFYYNLYPLDLWELQNNSNSLEENYQNLLKFGGFPEPFLEKNSRFHSKWSQSHIDIILKQDLLELESTLNISKIETLVVLLKNQVGSTVSCSSLARDLEVNHKTVKSWLNILENLFVIFRVSPYHKNISRSLLKESKYYFFDISQIEGDEGVKLENLVALSLKKQLAFLEDSKGIRGDLYFLKTKDKKEIDFYINFKTKKDLLIEVKLKDDVLSKNFKLFKKFIKNAKTIQLVKNLKREQTYYSGEEICKALPWLQKMPLLDE